MNVSSNFGRGIPTLLMVAGSNRINQLFASSIVYTNSQDNAGALAQPCFAMPSACDDAGADVRVLNHYRALNRIVNPTSVAKSRQ